jgi:hypothetical protein
LILAACCNRKPKNLDQAWPFERLGLGGTLKEHNANAEGVEGGGAAADIDGEQLALTFMPHCGPGRALHSPDSLHSLGISEVIQLERQTMVPLQDTSI